MMAMALIGLLRLLLHRSIGCLLKSVQPVIWARADQSHNLHKF